VASVRTLERFVSLLWFFYGLIVFTTFFCVADQPLTRNGILPLPATAAALVAVLPFSVLVFLGGTLRGNPLSFLQPTVKNRAPLLAFFLIALFSLLLSTLPGAFWDEGGKWIFLVSYGFILCLLAQYVALNKTIQKSFPVYTLCALGLLIYSLWCDMNVPGTFSDPNNRPAGFPGNANYAALVGVTLCAASLRYERGKPMLQDVVFLVTTAILVIGTMSRSGIVNYTMLLSTFLYYRFAYGGIALKDVVRFVVGLAIAIGVVAAIGMRNEESFAFLSKESRITRFLNNEQVDDGSAASRLAAATDSLRLIEESPIFGHGTGHARTMQELPHNLYLQQWVNNGLFGLLSYLLLLLTGFFTFLSRRCRPGQALMAVATVGSLFSHNVLDQRPFLILFGFLLGASACGTDGRIAVADTVNRRCSTEIS
jgi:O-antigen ligase